ncbi:ergothioneine biosynthesis protein EgtB [Aliikangiella marina]|uniref:Ergothioneine biosynthesis protein EgtB n=1 Tax=Aliikangiella marina TaxID=1712262 RepID=A0A545T720_9GAMM|nr:ergothioneine biosynthesis protein EgtB [Aliikangiella marina]TQV73019.1 ergothioneine biosynthesis protein EgtB [Aliikangiella marina]
MLDFQPEVAQRQQAGSTSGTLLKQYQETRNYSIQICEGLSDEDLQAQSMADASPLKWHLAHTTWAFETFLLKTYLVEYEAYDPLYEYLFNSYYNAIGEQYPRPQRGLITRPSRETVYAYRRYVDNAMEQLITNIDTQSMDDHEACTDLLRLMINHEQQHQELMLTDFKHLLSFNPAYPKYRDVENLSVVEDNQMLAFEGGLVNIGHQDETFYFDNEGPRHAYFLNPYKLASRLVTNGEYLNFVESGGYQEPSFWLSEAWQKIKQTGNTQPLYWQQIDGKWFEYTLNGLIPLNHDCPVKHVNYFEATAFANWKDKRLPTEQEWEASVSSNDLRLKQTFNQLWQWTSSSYNAFPGFKPKTGAVGEYNGKFMVNQYVLRGGSIATPPGHIRASYRNFFYPDASWQFTGIRLAETI